MVITPDVPILTFVWKQGIKCFELFAEPRHPQQHGRCAGGGSPLPNRTRRVLCSFFKI